MKFDIKNFMSDNNGVKLTKKILKVIALHLAMCVLPLFFLPVFNNDPQYTVNVSKSGTQVFAYAIYVIVFFAAYIWCGRRIKIDRYLELPATIVSTLIIAASGVAIYFYIGANADNPKVLEDIQWLIFFNLPQNMLLRAFFEKALSNKILSTIGMLMPSLLIWFGTATNGIGKMIKKKRIKKGKRQ